MAACENLPSAAATISEQQQSHAGLDGIAGSPASPWHAIAADGAGPAAADSRQAYVQKGPRSPNRAARAIGSQA